MPRSLLLLPFFLAACATTDKDDSGSATNPTGDNCDTTVQTIPMSGAADAYYRGDIEFWLSEVDSTATITTDIPGTLFKSDDGLVLKWVLSAPLTPSTAYSATLSYCGGEVVLDFTTSALGAPLADASALVGNTYVVDLTAARIVEPPGIGDVLTGYLTTDILIGVSAVGASDIEMIGAIAVEDSDPAMQDMCTETIDFPTASFTESPFFSIGPDDTTFVVSDIEVNIQDLLVNGTFSADGNYFDGGVLSGVIDTRPLAGLVDESDPNSICALAVSFGAICEDCPADGEPYCLSLVADQIYAEIEDGLTLVPLTTEDVAACP